MAGKGHRRLAPRSLETSSRCQVRGFGNTPSRFLTAALHVSLTQDLDPNEDCAGCEEIVGLPIQKPRESGTNAFRPPESVETLCGSSSILSAVNHPPILLGTSSFAASGWNGSFYPQGMKPSDYLAFTPNDFTPSRLTRLSTHVRPLAR